MMNNASILKEILQLAKPVLSEGSDFGYTMPDGKHHIYIYPDKETNWAGGVSERFFVIEPNRVVDGAHDPMGDTYITQTQDFSEVLIGCQWCMEWFESDRAKEVSKDSELPDELIVRLANEAGWLEAAGKIEIHSWEDLQVAIQDAIQAYYENVSEFNPFTIEETIEKILLERFPAVPEPQKDLYKEIHVLAWTEESKYGNCIFTSLHPSIEAASARADEIRKEEDVNEMYWNYDITSEVVDVSQFNDASPNQLIAAMIQTPAKVQGKASLTDQILSADNKRKTSEKDGPAPARKQVPSIE